jgi:hypothetical protein
LANAAGSSAANTRKTSKAEDRMQMRNYIGLPAGILFSLIALFGESSAHDAAFEQAIRTAIPKPSRCDFTPEPLFFCRYTTATEQSLAMELSSTKDGLSASLTYNYADPKGAELLAMLSDFFGSIGIDAKSFDRCVWQSHTELGKTDIEDWQLLCRHTDFADRVTHEMFAYRNAGKPRSDERRWRAAK